MSKAKLIRDHKVLFFVVVSTVLINWCFKMFDQYLTGQLTSDFWTGETSNAIPAAALLGSSSLRDRAMKKATNQRGLYPQAG